MKKPITYLFKTMYDVIVAVLCSSKNYNLHLKCCINLSLLNSTINFAIKLNFPVMSVRNALIEYPTKCKILY